MSSSATTTTNPGEETVTPTNESSPSSPSSSTNNDVFFPNLLQSDDDDDDEEYNWNHGYYMPPIPTVHYGLFLKRFKYSAEMLLPIPPLQNFDERILDEIIVGCWLPLNETNESKAFMITGEDFRVSETDMGCRFTSKFYISCIPPMYTPESVKSGSVTRRIKKTRLQRNIKFYQYSGLLKKQRNLTFGYPLSTSPFINHGLPEFTDDAKPKFNHFIIEFDRYNKVGDRWRIKGKNDEFDFTEMVFGLISFEEPEKRGFEHVMVDLFQQGKELPTNNSSDECQLKYGGLIIPNLPDVDYFKQYFIDFDSCI